MKQYETKEDGNKVLILNDQWKIVFHDREERPRHEGGVRGIGGIDYGNTRIVIARWLAEDREHVNYLLWHRSSKYWADRTSGYVSAPASMEVHQSSMEVHRFGIDAIGRSVTEGGRLSKDRVLRNADRLAELTDIPAEVWRWVAISGDLRKETAAIYKLERSNDK